MHFIGIDIAKLKFDLAWINHNGSIVRKTLGNNQKGFETLFAWLSQKNIAQAHFCMEATGIYWEDLAEFLANKGFMVSVINPAQIKSFGDSYLKRSKTDRIDAELIAQFCKERQPKAWVAPLHQMQELKALVHRLDNLIGMRTQETNRLLVARTVVKPSIESTLAMIEAEIKTIERIIDDLINRHPDLRAKRELLESIDGIGCKSSAMLLAYIGTEGQFDRVRQVTAFAGLDVTHHQSGSSIDKKARLSKKGHTIIRKWLYMPAMVTAYKTSWGKKFRERLQARGKCGMVILGAMMRKLLQVAFGVLKSGVPFKASLHGA